MSRSYQRPENALKRASEFIDVGKSNRALEVLYEVIKRGKMRNSFSEKVLEPIMIKYLELCVDLKKSHLAKEGLYQYRNIFQSVNVSSLESVVRHYLQLAEERTEAARKESHQAVVDIDDLDNLTTPEEMLLSAVSGEDAQDRSDRTILTPWVKFLWESYRQCLELLRTNSRVERLYHDIAKHAFRFCEKYNRKTEFRKLCDNLRTHLSHIQKQQGSATAVNLNNPETQQMNLETRLEQLNYAIRMELWQEAYKAIEDISDLMNKSKKMPKPHVMASYFQKLSLVFLKAGNQLFHAAALFKLFQLLRDQKKNITPEELAKRASTVLVATLAIPLPSAHPEFDRFIETEKSALEKIDKLANLVSLPKPPTRASLIRDLNRMNVVACVSPELQSLYNLMEVEFDPLHLCTRMQAYTTWIQEHQELGLAMYVDPLQEMTITRLIKQVGQVYNSMTFNRLLELSVFVQKFHLERILCDLVRHNDMQIRIDHRSECIYFGTDLSESQREDLPEGPSLQALPSENIRMQLVRMSSALHQCLATLHPDNKKKEMEGLRAQTIQMYQQTKAREHMKILQRQHIIEERKEMLENQNLEREETIRRAHEETIKKQKEQEQQRLESEARRREKLRQEEQLKQIQRKQITDKLTLMKQTSYGQKMIEKFDEEELLNLPAEEILQRQVEELEKEQKELQQRLKAQEKKVDYVERAKRIVEIPMLKKQFSAEKERDREFWEAQEEERVAKLIEEHKQALEHSKRLGRMQVDRETFLETLKSARRSENEKKISDFNARLEVERKSRLAERREQRRQARKEEHYRIKAEEEQQRLDEEAKARREEEERLEREERERMEEEFEKKKAELERQAEIQREREREINERLAKKKELDVRGGGRDSQDRDDRGGGGSWRSRGMEPKEEPRSMREDRGRDDREGSSEGSKAWRPGGGAWRDKEKEKLDAWRPRGRDGDDRKDDDDKEEDRSDRGNRDIRRDEPEERDRGMRDIRRDEPPRDRDDRFGRRDDGPRGGFGRRDDDGDRFRRDDDRDGPPRDRFRRDDDGPRGGGFRRDDDGGSRGGFRRGDDDRDGPRGGFRRGGDDEPRDRDEGGWRRGPSRPGPPARERDDRGPSRDDRGPPARSEPSRSDEGGSWRSAAPARRDDRPPARDDRPPMRRGDDRGPPPRDLGPPSRDSAPPPRDGGGAGAWRARRSDDAPPRDERPKDEPAEDGWETVKKR